MQKAISFVFVVLGLALLGYMILSGGGPEREPEPLGPLDAVKAFLDATMEKDTNAMLAVCDGAARQHMRQLMTEIEAEEKRLGVTAVKYSAFNMGQPGAYLAHILSEDRKTLEIKRTIVAKEGENGYKVVHITD